jgi:secondary thiamine-phosphate synthase enzyme
VVRVTLAILGEIWETATVIAKRSTGEEMPFQNWVQRRVQLSERRRGFHLITDEITAALPELQEFSVGLLHLFLLHTSASLSINENADPDVRYDMETVFSRMVPEDQPLTHTLEGPDDMPAHVKSSLLGCSLTLPISRGCLTLGTWQGIYLGEHRDRGGARNLMATIFGWTN